MKLLMIIVETSCIEEIEVLLRQNGVEGYTEIPKVRGFGETGPRLGSSAYPKTSSVVFTVVPEEKVGRIVEDIRCQCDRCLEDMKVFAWEAEQVLG